METAVKILNGSTDQEKGAYLSAIASIATADMQASQTEIDHLIHLCQAADLSPAAQESVLRAADSTSEQELIASLDILKTSELRFSLLTDLFAFAKADGNYSEKEQQSVHKIAQYLGINDTQYGLLGELAEKTTAPSANTDSAQAQSAFGLGDKLQASGINAGSLIKGLVTIAAPLILSRMMNKRSGGAGNGGLLNGGGLGSLIGMLSGGKGMGSLGGMFGKMFGCLLVAFSLLVLSCGEHDASSKDSGETKVHSVPDSALPAANAPQAPPAASADAPPVVPASEEALIQGLAPITRDYQTVFVEVVDGGIILKGSIEKMRYPVLMQSIKALRPKAIDESQLVIK